MDDKPKTRVEWMRLEFDDARRRRLVKTSGPAARFADGGGAAQSELAVVIEPVATGRRGDHPTKR
jgi:hypothetical protein